MRSDEKPIASAGNPQEISSSKSGRIIAAAHDAFPEILHIAEEAHLESD
jgi:hypothetical protein